MKTSLFLLPLLCAAAVTSWGACSTAPTIVGTRWAFEVRTGEPSFFGAAAVGYFTVQGNGVLSITETISSSGQITRLDSHGGRWNLNADCTGGELDFNTNGSAVQYAFVFASNYDQMFLVSLSLLSNNGLIPDSLPGADSTRSVHKKGFLDTPIQGALTGMARQTPATACPAGTGAALNILDGTQWALLTRNGYYIEGPGPVENGTGSVGIFAAAAVNGRGVLSAIETVNATPDGGITRRATESGRYLVYDDCSGGELMLMNRGEPSQAVQLEFVFAGRNFDEVYFLADNQPGDSGDVVYGRAKRFPLNHAACPADPTTLIQGKNFSFKLSAATFGVSGKAAIGTFTVLPGGQLAVTETISDNGTIERRVQHGGKYILYPDCTGGELLFDSGGESLQLEFVYAGDTNNLFLVSDAAIPATGFVATGLGFVLDESPVVGVAVANPVQACPANPLDLLNGRFYSFRTTAAYQLADLLNIIGVDPSVGTFLAIEVAGGGVIQAVETINANGVIVREAVESGRYLMYPDCTGGEILLMNRGIPSNPIQFEFVFAGASDLFLLSDTQPATQLNVLEGDATLF